MGKTIVITGSSDGIGAAAARRLHADGHQVVVVGRSPEKTAAVATSIGAAFFVADFTRLDEVRALAEQLRGAYPQIDVLANNAGGVFGDETKTVDGFEKTFQINHLAPFLLTHLLMDTLLASKASVLQTSSLAARSAPTLDLENLDMTGANAFRKYGAAKLENILFTRELHRRFHDQGLSAVAFHPGNVATSFGSEATSKLVKAVIKSRLVRKLQVSPDQGADQLVWFSETQPDVSWSPGEYYEKRKPRKTNRQASDSALAQGLWEKSVQLLGL